VLIRFFAGGGGFFPAPGLFSRRDGVFFKGGEEALFFFLERGEVASFSLPAA